MEPSVVVVFERSLVNRLELERDTAQQLDRDFASLRSVELGQASAGVSAGADIDCRLHSVVLGQEILGLLLMISYHIAGTAVEEPHKRHRSIVVGHKTLVGCCQYRNSQQCQLQQVHCPKWLGTLSKLVFAEEDYSRRLCVGYRYLIDALRACDHSNELQWRAWRGGREVHLSSSEQSQHTN